MCCSPDGSGKPGSRSRERRTRSSGASRSAGYDGSGDGEINIKELENYEVGPVPDSDLEDSDEEDLFAESD